MKKPNGNTGIEKCNKLNKKFNRRAPQQMQSS